MRARSGGALVDEVMLGRMVEADRHAGRSRNVAYELAGEIR